MLMLVPLAWSNCCSTLLMVVLIHWSLFCSFLGGKSLLLPCVYQSVKTLLLIACTHVTHRRLLGLAFCWQTERIIFMHKVFNLSMKQEVLKWFGETSQKRLRLGNFHFSINAWNGLHITFKIVFEDHQNRTETCYKFSRWHDLAQMSVVLFFILTGLSKKKYGSVFSLFSHIPPFLPLHIIHVDVINGF